MKLDGKVALVTGAASGIGHAHRQALCRGRRPRRHRRPQPRCCARPPRSELGDEKTAIAVAMDVTNEEQVNAGVETTVAAFGRVDILVSNAGIQIVHPIEEFPFADWKKLLAIHLDGAFLTTKACVKHMYKQGSGSLIYMGSVHSHEASPLKSAYVAAKHGILGLAPHHGEGRRQARRSRQRHLPRLRDARRSSTSRSRSRPRSSASPRSASSRRSCSARPSTSSSRWSTTSPRSRCCSPPSRPMR